MNKNLFRMSVVAAAVSFASAAHGATEKSLNLIFNANEQCKSLSVGFTFASDHTKKGDRNGRMNEHNHGKVGECFLDQNRNFYMLTGALVNSQWGPTLFHGYGARVRSPQLWKFSGEVGYEIALTYYEQGCPYSGPYAHLCNGNQRAIVAPLPMLYVGVNVELPSVRQILSPFLAEENERNLHAHFQRSMGEITIGRRTLGAGMRMDEKIYLYNVTWTYKF